MIKTRETIRGAITASEIQKAYKEAFKVPWWQMWFGNPFKLADQSYLETDEALIKTILGEDKTELEEYTLDEFGNPIEDFDCDDFAFRLMGVFHQNRKTAAMPIFITWVLIPQGGHAVLSYYSNGVVNIIEPQTDEVFGVPDWQLLLLCG